MVTESAGFGKRTEHQVVVFDNKMWLMGGTAKLHVDGDLSDIWCSDDGKIWNLVTNSAQWGKRSGFGVGVLKDTLFLAGGAEVSQLSSDYFTDVWRSSDGKTWSQLTAKGPWSKRVNSTFSIYSDQLWIMGGYMNDNGLEYMNDVWTSSNGTDWSQADVKAEWPGRCNFTTLSYDNKLWVIGGCEDGFPESNNFSDVWYTELPTGMQEQKNAVVMPNHSLNIEKTSRNGVQIHFKVEETTPVRIGLFNSIGQEVASICNDIRRQGEHTIPWNGSNSKGRTVSGGIYFINFKTKNENVTHKVLFR